MNKEQKISLFKIAVAIVLYIIAELLGDSQSSIACFLLSYAIVGYKPILKAIRNIANGQIFDENFLMTIATCGALALKQWDEAVAVML